MTERTPMCNRWLHRWSKWARGASYHEPFFRFWERRECRRCGHVQAHSINNQLSEAERSALARSALGI